MTVTQYVLFEEPVNVLSASSTVFLQVSLRLQKITQGDADIKY